jgi:hypothetical protein
LASSPAVDPLATEKSENTTGSTSTGITATITWKDDGFVGAFGDKRIGTRPKGKVVDDLGNQTVPGQARRRDFVDANVMSSVGRPAPINIERR